MEKEGCMDRLIQFVGAKEDEMSEWMEGGQGELGTYWKM